MKMFSKYKLIIALLCVASCSLTACKKFLMEDPKNLVTETNYYKTSGDAISAVNSIYGYLNSTSTGTTAGVYHSSFWVAAGLASDELSNNQLASPNFDQLATFTYGPQNSTLQDIWSTHYKAITIANIAIARIPAIAMDETLKQRLLNEAHFLRGLLYFDLVRMFGSVPLVIVENDVLKPSAASVDAIYTQVLTDLTAAENLPASYTAGNGLGRATSGAAKAILAKVYLTRKDWAKCAAKAKEVINSNQYSLWDDYADVFKLSSRNGKEAIFSVGFGDGGGSISFWEVGQFNVRLLPSDLSVEGVQNAQGWQFPTLPLYNSYDQDDRRRSTTFITEIHNTNGTTKTIRPYIQKYWDRVAEPAGNGSANDYPVIRYADVLLMYAEASNELGNSADAYKYINMVRKRARFNGTAYLNILPDYSSLTKDEFRAAVLQERKWEFVAEGQRWFDLARTGTLEKLVPIAKPGVVPSAKNYLFPIPQTERDVNPNLPQNAGY
ncbi:RagB/SusD family nutrient uptake outer membrane protein [Mucilaginibacter rigui]|uniref:RagB/SusD family nutrient uptake outer membrane protein n=1 Tax=Mucilaginibacter rigui TaxID=534635 RepID=A0ABR7X8Z5_9SPHI|nr:RagB/SusD family nutrient uptake outer membrane protein [Mucilaginibacter rigui]MBD1387049.1 RagB/SusD family nutrient uptake outer membrane protein [Mucilaginibacter rigui]